MENATPDPELLYALRKLARGLSALFWGLPSALVISVQTVRAEFLRPLEMIPVVAVNALLIFGLMQMGSFQKQERPWRLTLDRAQLAGLVNLGLCPFLFWFNQMPEQNYFQAAVFALIISSLMFLFNINVMLRQLGAMLPDETLRHDVNQFTALNRGLVILWLAFVAVTLVVSQWADTAARLESPLFEWFQQTVLVVSLFLALSTLAITMGLIWKIKEVIFDSVFGVK
jgi:hypothetical protein